MHQVQTLRVFVQQRLTVAAEEIFELFERTVAEYENALRQQRKLLDAVFKPDVRLHRADVQLQSVCKEVAPLIQQEWTPSLDQDDPLESQHIKVEQEELWTSQEGVQLQGLDDADSKSITTPVPVKSEEPLSHHFVEVEEKAHGEAIGGPKPDGNCTTRSNLELFTDNDISGTDHNFNWEVTSGVHLGLNPLRNNEEPKFNNGKTPVPSSECVPSVGHMKPFSCSVCGRKYNCKRSLSTHMRLHSEGKCISCPVCKKTFPFRAQLSMHMRVHTGEKPFSCSVCSSRFARKDCLRDHMRIHSGEKPFSCSVCGTRFIQRANLLTHIRTHTGEKPFSCDICGKRFAQRGSLRNHMGTHTGEKPFSCSVCDKRFTRLINLKKHRCVRESIGSI